MSIRGWWRHRSGRRGEGRDARGAVAVEAALVSAFILAPLLLGILFYGNVIWKTQRVSTLDVDGIPPESVAGSYNCAQLTTRIKELLASNAASAADQLGVPASAVSVVVTSIHALPDVSLGVDVSVAINVDVGGSFGISGPLPGGGTVSTSYSQQLPNVKLDTVSC